MKNLGKYLLILFSILVLSSCGIYSDSSSSTNPEVTIILSDTQPIAPVKGKEKQVEEPITVTRKTTTTTEAKKEEKTDTSIQTSQTETTIKEFFVYKPSTHYVHRSTCIWVDDTCEKIKNTKGLEARLCTDCNPDIKIYQEYKEPITTTSATTTTVKATTTKKNIPIITTTPKIFVEEETTTTTKDTKKETTTTTTTKDTKKETTKKENIEKEEVEIENNTYRLPYDLSENEWWWICKVVCSETGYCGEKQQKAVANTIFNRLIWAAEYGNCNPFPTDAIAVVQQPGQYDAYKYWRSDTRLQPGGSLWNQTMQYIKEAASEPDFTNGAIGYYNPAMSGYLSAFENNNALLLAYADETGRFFKLNPNCYSRK